MKKVLSFVKSQILDRLYALKKVETYIALLFGFLLVAGVLFPPVNYVFYLSFLYPSYLAYKHRATYSTAHREKVTAPNLLYYWLPYFLVVGVGIWDHIFPYYLGIILSILLADLMAVLMHKAIGAINSTTGSMFVVPGFFFLFDYVFQKIPLVRYMEMAPLLTSAYNHVPVLRVSSVFGSHVALFLAVLFVSATVWLVLNSKGLDKKPSQVSGMVVICVLALAVLSNSISAGNTGTPVGPKNGVVVSAVQASLSRSRRQFNSYTEYMKFNFENYREMIQNQEADIFVFPETMFGIYDVANAVDAEYREKMIGLAREKDALIVFVVTEGNSATKSKEERFITALLVSKDGIIGKSSKRNLVPFSETSRYSRGKDYQVFDTGYGKIGISICYDVNSGTMGKLKANGADIILAPFNDSGFGTAFHNVHRYYSVINAAQYSIPVAMASEDGISQLIGPDGRVIEELGIGEKGVISYRYHLRHRSSYYLIFGRYVEIALFLLILISGVVYLIRRPKGQVLFQSY